MRIELAAFSLALLCSPACVSYNHIHSARQEIVVLDETRTTPLVEAWVEAQRVVTRRSEPSEIWFRARVWNLSEQPIEPVFELEVVDRADCVFAPLPPVSRVLPSPVIPPSLSRSYDVGFRFPPDLAPERISEHVLEIRVLVPGLAIAVAGSSSFSVHTRGETYGEVYAGYHHHGPSGGGVSAAPKTSFRPAPMPATAPPRSARP